MIADVVNQYEGWWATKPVKVKEGILFSFYSPGAKEVFLAGDFNGWKSRETPLIKGRDDVWRVILELKPNRAYDYKYIVDGNWVNDPNNRDLNPDIAGGANSVIFIGEKGDILAERAPERHKFTLEGRGIKQRTYRSTNYNRDFEFYYIPLQTQSGRERLPVVICLNNYIKSQELDLYARQNGFLAVIPSVILGGEYIRQGKLDVFPELLEVVKDAFPVDEDRVFVTGMSNGGLEALLVSLYYPDLIAASAVVFGPYRLRSYRERIEGMTRDQLERFLEGLDYPQRMLLNLRDFPVYISHGSADEAIPLDEALTLQGILNKLGARTELTTYPEYGHTWTMVDEDLPRVFNWFQKFKKNRFPKDIWYTAPNGLYKSSIFWIEFSPIRIEEPLRIEANISWKNRINLETRNIGRIKLNLDSNLLKLPGMVDIETSDGIRRFDVEEASKGIELTF
ncbi:MAG: prolyl oligopeptidase family serine peptidase [Thermodesulfobacteriota bacterium]